MTFPSPRDWLFSLKTFAAAMIALYIALAFQLPRPYWAMATVYIVSNPFLGATRSKALFRVVGTVVGAACAVLIVPPFVESPFIFSVIVALWTGTLLYLALNDRTARSYVFMLAGYTLPLIALPAVTEPGAVFDIAIARTQEIILGIVCASIVGGAILPNRLAPSFVERTDSWFRDAALYVTEMLSGRIAGAGVSACRQRLAREVNGLEFLLSQLAYDHAPALILAHSQALAGRMQLLMPIMSSLADSLMALPGATLDQSSGPGALLINVAAWFNTPLGPADAEARFRREADTFRQHITRLQPPAGSLDAWENALELNALWRLRQLLDVWQDCRALRATIAHERGIWPPRFRHWRLGGSERYFDRGMLLFSAGTAALAIVAASSLWIGSGWHDGASAVSMAAIACSFFAALDEPAPGVFRFFIAGSVSLVVAGFGVFAVLPYVNDFPMLVIVLAGPFLLIGTQIARPRFSLFATLVAFNTANFISIQDAYNADFLVFLNTNVASVTGLLFAFLWTRVTRPFGAELAAARLVRSGWEDVVRCASTRPIDNQRDVTARMLDRVMQLIPKLATVDDHHHHSIGSFRDLRVAFCALDLHRLHRRLQGDMADAIDRVLEDICVHFEGCIEHRARVPVLEGLRSSLDAAIHRVIHHHAVNTRAGTASSGRHLRTTLNVLVGLRLSLLPLSVPSRLPDVHENPG
ncbi:MAG TPA: FUSC family protein [Paraburkholderia sp.]|uniref:FUSC family protein n=1 Tax=Paraburkholderia sp. TaxID=1926495 RepID=UPI002B46B595|nr:FUSC family protein [Paraburkholderia sp.]HKR44874.1 FUSC family protein [Paraburkholderia sp.]